MRTYSARGWVRHGPPLGDLPESVRTVSALCSIARSTSYFVLPRTAPFLTSPFSSFAAMGFSLGPRSTLLSAFYKVLFVPRKPRRRGLEGEGVSGGIESPSTPFLHPSTNTRIAANAARLSPLSLVNLQTINGLRLAVGPFDAYISLWHVTLSRVAVVPARRAQPAWICPISI